MDYQFMGWLANEIGHRAANHVRSTPFIKGATASEVALHLRIFTDKMCNVNKAWKAGEIDVHELIEKLFDAAGVALQLAERITDSNFKGDPKDYECFKSFGQLRKDKSCGQVLNLLERNPEGLSILEISIALDMKPPTARNHIKKLEKESFVEGNKLGTGKVITYQITESGLDAACRIYGE